MTILILHGIGGHAGIHWQKWLGENLAKDGHRILMPNLPDSERPDRKTWLAAIREITKDINSSGLVIVAHSLGVPAALDLIEERPAKALVCVSGFADDYGAELNSYFLSEKKIDFEKVNRNIEKALVVYGDNDPYVPQEVLQSLADSLGVRPEIVPSGGHLNSDSGYQNFPQLLKIIRNEIEVFQNN